MSRPVWWSAVLCGLLVLVGGCGAIPVRDDSGAIVQEGELSVFDLVEDDCFESLDSADTDSEDATVDKVEVVPCTYRHHYRVVGVPTVDGDEYPGRDELAAIAETQCDEATSPWISEDVVFEPLLPTPESWEGEDDRTILCVIRDDTGTFDRNDSVAL